ncbi:MAG: hypothetical protein ACLFWD_11145, partial [Anaerolineales bacterium]
GALQLQLSPLTIPQLMLDLSIYESLQMRQVMLVTIRIYKSKTRSPTQAFLKAAASPGELVIALAQDSLCAIMAKTHPNVHGAQSDPNHISRLDGRAGIQSNHSTHSSTALS